MMRFLRGGSWMLILLADRRVHLLPRAMYRPRDSHGQRGEIGHQVEESAAEGKGTRSIARVSFNWSAL